MIRRGHYGKYKGKIYKITVSSNNIIYVLSNDDSDFGANGFIKNISYEEHPNLAKYYATITQEKIEWFCKICTKGKYKGEDVNIDGEENGKYLISSNLILEKDRGVFSEEHGFKAVMEGGYGTYIYAGYVDKSEVTDVKEIKTPINEDLKAPDNWDF